MLTALLAACGGGGDSDDDPANPDAGADPSADAAPTPDPDAAPPNPAQACPAGPEGLACLFDQFDLLADCDAEILDAFEQSIAAREGTTPAWHAGRGLFITDAAAAVAGEFNDWDATALATTRVCASALFAADTSIASGHYQYKIVVDGTWMLDPHNWAYAFDDFEGNPDGRNSVLNTYDSGVGHLVRPKELVCSEALGNCRPLNTYLPAGYGAPTNAGRDYPVLFMHDGQNIFDDTSCCFGFGGWQVNVALDQDIGAGVVEPVVVVGFDNGLGQRNDEYGWPESEGGLRSTFMQLQVDVVQPTAAQYWRLDADRYYTAGSSLGGNIAFHLAFAYPDVYAGAASMSGAFWPGEDTSQSFPDALASIGRVDVQLYLDHGGSASSGGDNYFLNVEVRDSLIEAGWAMQTSPDCEADADLCYFHDVGAAHNEIAWRLRVWRMMRYLFAAE